MYWSSGNGIGVRLDKQTWLSGWCAEGGAHGDLYSEPRWWQQHRYNTNPCSMHCFGQRGFSSLNYFLTASVSTYLCISSRTTDPPWSLSLSAKSAVYTLIRNIKIWIVQKRILNQKASVPLPLKAKQAQGLHSDETQNPGSQNASSTITI